jgi:hypothetical protein
MPVSLLISKKNIFIQLPAMVITMTFMVVLPIFVHIFPGIGNTPLGAFLLPIYFAPLIAIFLFHPLVSVFAGLTVPYLNYLLTGQPVLPVATSLTIELVLFSIVMLYFSGLKVNNYWFVPLAFGLGKIGSALFGIFSGSFLFFGWINGILYSIPGLLLLVLLNSWLVRQVNIIDR